MLALNVAVFVGGALGAIGRYGLHEAIPPEPGRWPWATFAANMAGCLLFGLVAAALVERRRPSAVRGPLLGTGLCGALTTFAALPVEAAGLADGGHGWLAAAYLGATIAAGLALVAAGTGAVRARRRAAP